MDCEMKPKFLNRKKLNEQFEAAHKLGVERHGTLWLTVNEAAVKAADMVEAIDVTELQTKTLLSVVVLRVLDRLKREDYLKEK